jgi:3-oxoacyl-[acyl-carrier-protein] synthase III
MDEVSVGIASAAVRLPAQRRSVAELCAEEKADAALAERLGIHDVPLCCGESGSALALAACQEALQGAQLDPALLDVIVDYSILPQEYLVPAWNMSNKLQHELGAKKAFTVGFSGGGATNFLVALSSAAAMLAANPNLKTALLVAADVSIPGNRVLNPQDPVTVLGDSAAAVVLQRGATRSVIVDTEFHCEGANHDICCIPGGALAHPDDPNLYRMVLDKPRYDQAPKLQVLQSLMGKLQGRAGVSQDEIAFVLYPNLSPEDRGQFQQHLELSETQMPVGNGSHHGHLQGTDFVVNYLSMLQSGAVNSGDYVLAASHGMGFLAGVALFRM